MKTNYVGSRCVNGGWVVVFDNNKQHFITAGGVLSFSFVFDVPEGAEGAKFYVCSRAGTWQNFSRRQMSTYKFLMIVVRFDDCVPGLETCWMAERSVFRATMFNLK